MTGGDQVWLRKEGVKPLKSSRQVSVVGFRISGVGDELISEVQIERFYAHSGKYRRTWIKREALLRDYTLKHEQETLV